MGLGEGISVSEGVCDRVAGDAVRWLLGVGVAVAVETEAVRDSEAEGEAEGVMERDSDTVEKVWVQERVRDFVGVGMAVGEYVGVMDAGAVYVEIVTEALRGDGEAVAVAVDRDGEREAEAEGVLAVPEALRLREALKLRVRMRVWVGLGVRDVELVRVGASVGVGVPVWLGVKDGEERERDEVVEMDPEGLATPVREAEAEALEGVGETERVTVRVEVGNWVRVGV